MNEGCVVVGRPHPSLSFTKPILQSTKPLGQPAKETSDDENWVDEKSMFAIWRGHLFILSSENICVRIFKVPKGFPTFPMEFPGMEGRSDREQFRCKFIKFAHPSLPFTKPHPTVIESAWEARYKNLWWMKFQRMKNQYLQNEGVACSCRRLRACVWEFSKFP